MERNAMNILNKLFDVFGKRRALLLGATTQPNDLIAHIHAVRAHAYFRITGKRFPILNMPSSDTIEDMTNNLSPSRRLARRGL